MARGSPPHRIAKRRPLRSPGPPRISQRQRSKLAEEVLSSSSSQAGGADSVDDAATSSTTAIADVTMEKEAVPEDREMVDSQEYFDAQSQNERPGLCPITDADVNPFHLMKMPAEIRNEIYRACLTRPFNILLSRMEPAPPQPEPMEAEGRADGVVVISDTEEDEDEGSVVPRRSCGPAEADRAVQSFLTMPPSAGSSAVQGSGSPSIANGVPNWAARNARPIRLSSRSSFLSGPSTAGASTAGTTLPADNSQFTASGSTRGAKRAVPKQDTPRTPRPQDVDPLIINLLRCSKTIYQEARSILYAENFFTLDLDTALPTLAALHQRSRRQIKHVEVEIPCYNEILERFQETVRLSLRYCWGLKKFVIHMPFTLPGADGSGTTGNTTVYANGFDILRWLPRHTEVFLKGKICAEIEQVVSKNAKLARTLDEAEYISRQSVDRWTRSL